MRYFGNSVFKKAYYVDYLTRRIAVSRNVNPITVEISSKKYFAIDS